MEPTIAVAEKLGGGAAAFRASSAERLEPAGAPSSFAGVNRWVALAAALLLHAAILAPILLHFDFAPRAAPPEREIPVEIVVEQPKPPEPQPQPSAAPPPPPIDLAPAHDAPRAASDAKTPRYGAAAKTNGEKSTVADQPQAGAPTPPSQAAQPTETAKVEPPSPSPPAGLKDDDGEQQANAAPPLFTPPATSSDAPEAKTKVATMLGQPLPTWSKGKRFSTFDVVPDGQFQVDDASPIGGGQAATTYNTILFGLVMKHMSLAAPASAEGERLRGSIDFTVDVRGDVVELSVVRPSGSNTLDAAALEAVREAAPYPMPPMAMPIDLTFNYVGR